MGSPDFFNLFIDDSGSRLPDRPGGPARRDGMDCFALGGVLVLQSDVPGILRAHKAFRAARDLDGPLHSTRIRSRREHFAWLGKDAGREREFLDDLTRMLMALPFVAVACVIHRPGYNARYFERYGTQRWRLCKTAYAVLIERVAKFADGRGLRLKVYFEQAGRREDRAVIQYHKDLKAEGMPFARDTSAIYAPLTAADFARILIGAPERRTKELALCQIADLVLYPIAKAKYDPAYRPYGEMAGHAKLIDNHLAPESIPHLGIKYSCFDNWPPDTPKAQR